MCWVGHPSGWRHSVVIVELLSGVRLFATLWAATRQASLSFTATWSLLSFLPIESVVPSSHFILCCPFLLLPSVFPGIRVFSNDSSHQVAKVLELQLQYLSFQWIFRVDYLLYELVWSPCCPRNSRELFPAPQFRSINSSEDFLLDLTVPWLCTLPIPCFPGILPSLLLLVPCSLVVMMERSVF